MRASKLRVLFPLAITSAVTVFVACGDDDNAGGTADGGSVLDGSNSVDATSGNDGSSDDDSGNVDSGNRDSAANDARANGDTGADADAAPPPPAQNCKAILAAAPNSASGVYVIDPDGTAGPLTPLSVHCDMTFAGGGWTLILSNLPGRSLDNPGDAGGDASADAAAFYVRPPLPGQLGAFKGPIVAALSASAAQVHIRSPFGPDASADAGAYITSLLRPDGGPTLPVENLRALKGLNTGGDGGFGTEWGGTNATALRLNYENSGICAGVNTQTYPSLYWACNNTNGLHLTSGTARWVWVTPATPNEAMEVYIR